MLHIACKESEEVKFHSCCTVDKTFLNASVACHETIFATDSIKIGVIRLELKVKYAEMKWNVLCDLPSVCYGSTDAGVCDIRVYTSGNGTNHEFQIRDFHLLKQYRTRYKHKICFLA